MGYFPMCISLKGQTICLAGNGPMALEKLKLLLPFGANLQVYTANPAFFQDYPEQFCNVTLHNRPLTETDLRSPSQIEKGLSVHTLTEEPISPRPAFVVVADVPIEEKKRLSALCQKNHIPVNVVDVPELCSFYFPAMIQQGDLTVSVSTGGKSPGAAAYLKKQLAAEIPDQTEAILDWLGALRKELPERIEKLIADSQNVHKYNLNPSDNTDISTDDTNVIFIKALCRNTLKKATELAFQQNRPLTEDEVAALLSSQLPPA